ncbi:MAG TPA: 3-isopropylmalate dehydratase small subunit [Verrucomicrobiae bacterium]|jgi:3-isopropylmalate/(R)-2-methylmalate dehydratase small subunit|nr:3-isopropylmalate dehydratase small subunit [Verrucomicrobiae bacterium]
MEAFQTHRGVLAPLDTANVDTDQIIAKQFLKSIKRTGFGEYLFYDWRYKADGSPNADFPLNRPAFQKASILVARNNFGCGSSREHAVWAVHQYGFKAVIAPRKGEGNARIPGFADIFRNNSGKNGLLTVELGEAEVEEIFQMIGRFPGLEATVDLDEQRVVLHLDEEISFHFDIDPAVKKRLYHGLDDIGTTLQEKAAIDAFEKKHDAQFAAGKK